MPKWDVSLVIRTNSRVAPDGDLSRTLYGLSDSTAA